MSELLIISAILNLAQLIGMIWLYRRVKKFSPPEDFIEYLKFKKDLRMIGGALIEFRRVSPDDVFIRS